MLDRESFALLTEEQSHRNARLLAATPCLGERIESHVLPFTLDLKASGLTRDQSEALSALEKTAATIAIEALVSLAQVGDIDHLGGGLELIPPLLMTLSVVDYDKRQYTIEHGHTSIGYYASLAALGFLPPKHVITAFRRSLDIAGHVSWVPGGTELSSGRLGVMVPVGTGLALGLKATKGSDSIVFCHCGDAGWISGQALNGFVAAGVHHAPIVFIMHRNGIQLSGTTKQILDKDPRPTISSLGIDILEIPSLEDRTALFGAYKSAADLARAGKPALIYPVGYRSTPGHPVTVKTVGEMYGIEDETRGFAEEHGVAPDTEIWIPGSLMSFRDVRAMLECVFYVNRLPGGAGHHDGGMKGRDAGAVLSNRMLQLTEPEKRTLEQLKQAKPRTVVTTARPPKGTPNLALTTQDVKDIQLPGTGKRVTARAGSEAAYLAIAKKFPEKCFVVSCDLNPSTKLEKAAAVLPPGHVLEMGIEEQAAALMTDGLAFSSRAPQLNVFSTFGAFIEGIAREGFEMWRYQRNLTGLNEGLNLVMHMSHVGTCTGRDHFSGWSLDWVNFGLGYLPYLRRFYAPADARAAFLAIKDAAAGMGGHIVAVPRDNLPVLAKAGTTEPLWNAWDEWTPVTTALQHGQAETAILALGAPTFVALEGATRAAAAGVPTDVHVINGFPLPTDLFADFAGRYRRILTIEDGLIGTLQAGLRGFAAFVAGELYGTGVELHHLGVSDPQIAPSDDYLKVWEHYGMTADAVADVLLRGRD